jgi:PIN domain nuclease of toxin-antitoxin system
MIYLDTHVVVWLFADKDMLSKNARRLIEQSHSIFISPNGIT